jgi:hypothetical protein
LTGGNGQLKEVAKQPSRPVVHARVIGQTGKQPIHCRNQRRTRSLREVE